MANFKKTIGKKVLIIDGAMGTLLMEAGVRPEEGFDLQNLKNPDIVEAIHKKYIDAGANIIETNTFGANRIKLEDYKAENKVAEINKELLKLENEKNKLTGYTIAPRVGKGLLTRLFEWLFNVDITGYAVHDGNETLNATSDEISNITSNITSVIIEDVVSSVEVEYYTEAPVSEEVNISNGKRIVFQ